MPDVRSSHKRRPELFENLLNFEGCSALVKTSQPRSPKNAQDMLPQDIA